MSPSSAYPSIFVYTIDVKDDSAVHPIYKGAISPSGYDHQTGSSNTRVAQIGSNMDQLNPLAPFVLKKRRYDRPSDKHMVMSTIALATGAKSAVAELDKKTAAHSISLVFFL